MDSPSLPEAPLALVEGDQPVSTAPKQRSGHASEQSENTVSSSSDKLAPLPGISTPSSNRIYPQVAEQTALSSFPTAPSSNSHREFPPISGSDTPRTAYLEFGSKNVAQRSLEGNRNLTTTVDHSPRSRVHVHPLLREAVSHPFPRAGDSATSRPSRASDPPRPSSIIRVGTHTSRKPSFDSYPGASPLQSRATSPMRFLQWGFNRQNPREELFVPVNPFLFRIRPRGFSISSPDLENSLGLDRCSELQARCFSITSCDHKDTFRKIISNIRVLMVDIVVRQVYLHLLLRLPSLYFSRIARVFEDAEVSQPDIERMIKLVTPPRSYEPSSSPIPTSAQFHSGPVLPFPEEWNNSNVSPALVRFKLSWESFIESLLREWKTFNLVSALLLSAILSMFQNQEMAYDPVIRTAALLSLVSALMSLSYGCAYIVRFGTMRSMYKATRWAQEAQRTTTFILWNVWVMLAMPGVWLAWSMIFFIIAILAFVWRSGSTTDPTVPSSLSPGDAIGPRIAVSTVALLGLIYFAAIVKTLSTYGRDHRHREQGERESQHEREQGRGRRSIREGQGSGRGADLKETTSSRATPANKEVEHRSGQGVLPAVVGLGLTGLDGIANQQEGVPLGKHPSPASI